MHILCVNANCYLALFGTRSGFFGEDRLATLVHCPSVVQG